MKTSQSLDTSGSWMVIVDDSIIGITTPTVSQEPFNSTSFVWEFRNLTFKASDDSHTIKFLPLDDDIDLLSSPSNINGSLYMGIDYINIEPIDITSVKENQPFDEVMIFPNPTKGLLNINTNTESIDGILTVFSISGAELTTRKVKKSNIQIDLSGYENGIYFVRIEMNHKTITRLVMKH
ncbi:MAG: T9SS type A sorting domain-containing protein [Saprospiraceae bacterium]